MFADVLHVVCENSATLITRTKNKMRVNVAPESIGCRTLNQLNNLLRMKDMSLVVQTFLLWAGGNKEILLEQNLTKYL